MLKHFGATFSPFPTNLQFELQVYPAYFVLYSFVCEKSFQSDQILPPFLPRSQISFPCLYPSPHDGAYHHPPPHHPDGGGVLPPGFGGVISAGSSSHFSFCEGVG